MSYMYNPSHHYDLTSLKQQYKIMYGEGSHTILFNSHRFQYPVFKYL
jgi:hypothetical protein